MTSTLSDVCAARHGGNQEPIAAYRSIPTAANTLQKQLLFLALAANPDGLIAEEIGTI